MANSLKYNAYHVLGLDTSASSKKILQRSNEIAQRLKIDDVPVYEPDISAFGSFRTESTVKDAVRRLQSPKLRVQEYFFWFRCDDDLDKAALALFARRDYSAAAQIWEQATTGSSDASFKCARHVALVRSLALVAPDKRERIGASLQFWKTLVESEEFWQSFARTYRFDGEFAASDGVLSDFRKNVLGYVSDVYAELQEVCKGGDYVYRFQKLFAEKGGRVEKDILNPALQAIQNAVGRLNAINVGKGATFDRESARRIKGAIREVQAELNTLVDAGLVEDGETKSVRDVAANAIRRIAVDLHNHQDELTKASKLLEVAASFAGTKSLRAMLATELTQSQNDIAEKDSGTLALDIPGTFGGGKIVFANNYLTYNNRKVFYKDVVSVAYQARSRSINFIPISQSYNFTVVTAETAIRISFGTTLYIDNVRKKDVWVRLAGASGHFIEPEIVEKLVRRIFQDGETVRIGGVDFDREGYRRSTMFRGRDAVLWRKTVYIPAFASGNVTLWKEKDGNAVTFTRVPMSTANAVVLPELIKSCVAVVRTHARQ